MIYLAFADEATALAALYDGTDDEGALVPRYPALQILNPVPMPVSRETGEVDEDGVAVREMIEGYHVNCLGDCPSELEAWRVYPETPFAVLA